MVDQSDWLPMMIATGGADFAIGNVSRGDDCQEVPVKVSSTVQPLPDDSESRNDIWKKPIFQSRNSILECQFFLFQSLKRNRFGRRRFQKSLDGDIEITVFLT